MSVIPACKRTARGIDKAIHQTFRRQSIDRGQEANVGSPGEQYGASSSWRMLPAPDLMRGRLDHAMRAVQCAPCRRGLFLVESGDAEILFTFEAGQRSLHAFTFGEDVVDRVELLALERMEQMRLHAFDVDLQDVDVMM
jgi:hypothetical protein